MELALGTVQFGLRYGISGAKRRLLSNADIRKILELAFQRGITILDTAPVYGDIESRLGRLCESLEFRIVSKIPPVPDALNDKAASRWAVESAQISRSRLGNNLYALLFHRAEDLLGSRGDMIWSAIAKWAANEGVLTGASGYDMASMRALFETRRIPIAQLPGNALDQRIDSVAENLNPKPELHLRSAFLQGLLLLPIEEAMQLVPSANVALQQWHRWLSERETTPLEGALAIVKGFHDVATCVVGIDNIGQLTELASAWELARPITARELSSDNAQAIDPRLWEGGENEARRNNSSKNF
jgi:aryl-alcohol dehydrogenase-like predicted oxidoreductase